MNREQVYGELVRASRDLIQGTGVLYPSEIDSAAKEFATIMIDRYELWFTRGEKPPESDLQREIKQYMQEYRDRKDVVPSPDQQ